MIINDFDGIAVTLYRSIVEEVLYMISASFVLFSLLEDLEEKLHREYGVMWTYRNIGIRVTFFL